MKRFTLLQSWQSPGPVSSAFMASKARVHSIQGPLGSGKTTTCFWKMVAIAIRQWPMADGVRRIKVCTVRDTYRQLWKTTIPSWHELFPPDIGEWTGSKDAPAKHVVAVEVPSDPPVIFEIIHEFVAIGEHKPEEILRGYQPTMFYLNEADLLSEEVLTFANGRAGRFPRKADTVPRGGPTWRGVIMDMNAPDEDSWAYDRLILNRPASYEHFVQPSGFSPNAENLGNLPDGYYTDAADGEPQWYVDRMLRNKSGFSRKGKPVWPEYNEEIHVAAKPLKPAPGIKLYVGIDGGGTPAAGFWQRMPNGQWRKLKELITEPNTITGPNRFGEMINIALRQDFEGIPLGDFYCDPSATYGADKEEGELAWHETVANVINHPIFPAPTNELSPRFEAIRLPMTRMIDGHIPGLLICPTLGYTRRAYASGYRFRKQNIPGSNIYSPKPEKNEWSHGAEADQYILLGAGEWDQVTGREERRLRSGYEAADSYDGDFGVL